MITLSELAAEKYIKVKSLTDFTHIIEPKPNRMTIWSREEWHGVQKVTNTDPNYMRAFFGTGWSSIKTQSVERFTAFESGSGVYPRQIK